jgi:adenylylsulfate reductase subunit A
VGAAPPAARLGVGDRHTLFREETRWPGYYYRGDHMKLDDENWHCFTLSRYDRDTGEWAMEKAPVYHIVD